MRKKEERTKAKTYKRFKQQIEHEKARHIKALVNVARMEAHWEYLFENVREIFPYISLGFIPEWPMKLWVESRHFETVHKFLRYHTDKVVPRWGVNLCWHYTFPEIGDVIIMLCDANLYHLKANDELRIDPKIREKYPFLYRRIEEARKTEKKNLESV